LRNPFQPKIAVLLRIDYFFDSVCKIILSEKKEKNADLSKNQLEATISI